MTPLHLTVTIIGTAYSAAQIVRFLVWLDTTAVKKGDMT